MASAALPIISAIGSALGSQGRSPGSGRPGDRPQIESALPVLATTKDKQQLMILKKQAETERLYNLLMQPEVLGLLMTIAGIFASNRISFSSNKGKNAALQGVATSASVLLGLGRAGVGDLTTLLVALGAGGLSFTSGGFPDLNPLPGLSDISGGSSSSSGYFAGAIDAVAGNWWRTLF